MSVVVKIRDERRVTYDTADYIQEEDGKLYVFAGDVLVGLHNQYEWMYATVHQDHVAITLAEAQAVVDHLSEAIKGWK